jgi:hypothetical protein
MEIHDAQREVRTVYCGGFYGQLVSAVLWLLAAALGTWHTPRSAILTLVLGGFFIFPLTMLLLRISGGRTTLRPSNSLRYLAMQVAFTLPLTLPLVGAAAMAHLNWFFPAFMIALGAHYLPFTFLYGMRMFALLGGSLVAGGLAVGLYVRESFAAGAWVTAGLLVLFAISGLRLIRREERQG